MPAKRTRKTTSKKTRNSTRSSPEPEIPNLEPTQDQEDMPAADVMPAANVMPAADVVPVAEDMAMQDRSTRLDFEPDKAFDDPRDPEAIQMLLPPDEKTWDKVKNVQVPKLNLSEDSRALTILDFLHGLEKYQDLEPKTLVPLVSKAYLGPMEVSWCWQCGFNYTMMRNKLLNWMFETDDWINLKRDVEMGKRLAPTFDEHISRFKMAAKYMRLRADGEDTKRLLLKSLGPEVLAPASVTNLNGTLRPLQSIILFASANRSAFDKTAISAGGERPAEGAATLAAVMNTASKQTNEEEEEAAAAINFKRGLKRPRKEQQQRGPSRRNVRCFYCGKMGHLARECWKKRGNPASKGSQATPTGPSQGPSGDRL